MIDSVAALLDAAVRAGHPPAASACAILEGAVVHESAHGVEPDSIFDVASITKVATTLAVARLITDGALSLEAPVARGLPRFAANGKARVTVRELLGHRSGLPAWSPFFLDVMRDPRTHSLYTPAPNEGAWSIARELVIDRALDAPLDRPGARVYSDLGFIALGALIESAGGARLDAFTRARIFEPLGLERELGFVDLAASTSWLDDRHVLATGTTRPREPAPGQEHLYRVPAADSTHVRTVETAACDSTPETGGRASAEREPGGRSPPEKRSQKRPENGVDDDNAYAMGGIAGHAGLFATARALATLGHHVIEELDGKGRLGIGEALRALEPIDGGAVPLRSLGFDRPAHEGSSAGALLGARGPRGAIGHLGFTGCSLWIDLDRRLSVSLLTNRTLPGRAHVAPIRALRPAFHDALCRAIG